MATTHRVIIHTTGEQVVVPIADANPPGWKNTGVSGTAQECFTHVAIAIRLKEEEAALPKPGIA